LNVGGNNETRVNSIVKPDTVAALTEIANRFDTEVCVEDAVKLNVACFHPALDVNGTVVLVNTVPEVERRSTVKLPDTCFVGGVGKR
jgi:hypothetical protein